MPSADELHKAAQARGRQRLGLNGQVIRSAVCPTHSRRSSDFWWVESDEKGKAWWVFGCDFFGSKKAEKHKFRALPDPHAPKSVEEVAAWMQGQKAAQIREVTKGA